MQKGEEGIWVDNIKGKIAMRNNQEGNEYQHKGDEGGKREGVSKKEKVKVLKKKIAAKNEPEWFDFMRTKWCHEL